MARSFFVGVSVFAATSLFALGCEGVLDNPPPGRRDTTRAPDAASTTDVGVSDAGRLDGLPCGVAAVLTNYCVSCHGAPLAGGASMPLRSYADLTAMSAAYPTQSYAARSLVRMHAAASPMPPSAFAPVPAAMLAEFEAWVTAGTPVGACGTEMPDAGRPPTHDAGPPPDAGPLMGLPCDVSDTLGTYCVSCHTSPLAGGATMPLRSYSDLVAISATHPGQSEAARSLARMRDATSPMPPLGATPVPAARIASFAAWVSASTPMGTCAGPTDPFDVPPTCTSGGHTTSSRANRTLMNPGLACLTCHQSQREAFYGTGYIAGTVYPTGHEPDTCNGGAASGGPVVVEITGADGAVLRLSPNAVGNFFDRRTTVRTPYTARVTQDGRERRMIGPQTSGDCNSCHTQSGTMMAPGRVLLP